MKSFITAIIVMLVLWFLKERTKKREEGMLEDKFLIKAPSGIFFLGAIEAGIGLVLLFWWSLGSETIWLAVAIIIGSIPGILLMILPISGVWEILVDHDNITVTKCFIFKKHFRFSDITHCTRKRGGSKVYVKGRKGKAFFVDAMMGGAYLFEQKIIATKIPIDGVIKEDKEDELEQISDSVMKEIVKTLNEGDPRALKKQFSEFALERVNNFGQQLRDFYEFYQGEIIVCDEVSIENIPDEGVKKV